MTLTKTDSKKNRSSAFEWLRILAMAMIVTLHYVFKGGMADLSSGSISGNSWFFTFIAALSVCAVNVYVLISGYFLTESEFKISRIVSLLIQILEYSVVITLVMILTGQVSIHELGLYDILGFILPVGTEEYWFISAYVVMYLFAPALSAGFRAMDRRTLRTVILVLLLFMSAEKTVIPMDMAVDDHGYGFGWFLVIFAVAVYIRRYDIGFLEGHMGRSVLVYVISALVICCTAISGAMLGSRTGIESFSHFYDISWDYNFLPVFTEAIGLFYIFKNLHLQEDTKAAHIAVSLGPLTLGIYLLHEHPLLRYRWEEWLMVTPDRTVIMSLLNWLICVAVIMAAGFAVEALRRRIHSLFTMGKKK